MKRKKWKKRLFKILFLLILILAFLYVYFNYFFLSKINYDTYGSIDYYDRYGIHFNLKGTIELSEDYEKPKLVLTNGITEIDLKAKLENDENIWSFSTSEYINDGINLEKLKNGNYYLLIKANKEDKNIYFPLKNNTKYKNITYFSLNDKKIEIMWDDYLGHEVLSFQIKNSKLPDDVYDITIDPGHDGNDPGMIVCSNGESADSNGKCVNGKTYKESDLNFIVSTALKEELEKLGYKVKLTRDSKEDTVSTYGNMGSATSANTTKSKFNLALHHNSTNVPGGLYNIHGLEVYVAGNSKLDLAEEFVKNITKEANISVSTKKEFKVAEGIYQRLSDNGASYYYMIREVGGIATGAYADGSNKVYGKNPYYDSNDTAESYLLELGYIDNFKELKNIINNPKDYARGIAKAIYKYLK